MLDKLGGTYVRELVVLPQFTLMNYYSQFLETQYTHRGVVVPNI